MEIYVSDGTKGSFDDSDPKYFRAKNVDTTHTWYDNAGVYYLRYLTA